MNVKFKCSIKIILILLGLIGSNYAKSQFFKSLFEETYLKGFIVFSNDTVPCEIMLGSESQNCAFVKVKFPNSDKKFKYSATEVKYYKIGTGEYYSVERKGALGVIDKVFMIPVIKGPINLYAYHYVARNQYASFEAIKYYLQRENYIAMEVKKLDFAKKISNYIEDSPALSNRVKQKELRYDDLSTIVTNYNKWYNQQKHEDKAVVLQEIQTNTQNDTLPVKSFQEKPIEKVVKSDTIKKIDTTKNYAYSNKAPSSSVKVGFDVSTSLARTFVDVPSQLDDQITYFKGGMGYDFGVGLRIDFSEYVNLKIGINTWNRKMNVDYWATATDNYGNDMDVVIKENGVFRYFGGYIKMYYTVGPLFAGGGINFSFSGKYNCDYGVYPSNGSLPLANFNNESTSPLVYDKVNGQFDLVLAAGLSFNLSKTTKIKPMIEGSLSVKPLVVTGAYEILYNNERNDLDIYSYSLKFGVIFEFFNQ